MTAFPRGEIVLCPDVRASCSHIQDIIALYSYIKECMANPVFLLSTLLLLPFSYPLNVLSDLSYLGFISPPTYILSIEE